jgi:hypothetical protein
MIIILSDEQLEKLAELVAYKILNTPIHEIDWEQKHD